MACEKMSHNKLFAAVLFKRWAMPLALSLLMIVLPGAAYSASEESTTCCIAVAAIFPEGRAIHRMCQPCIRSWAA